MIIILGPKNSKTPFFFWVPDVCDVQAADAAVAGAKNLFGKMGFGSSKKAAKK